MAALVQSVPRGWCATLFALPLVKAASRCVSIMNKEEVSGYEMHVLSASNGLAEFQPF
jgi:hypothetical protein